MKSKQEKLESNVWSKVAVVILASISGFSMLSAPAAAQERVDRNVAWPSSRPSESSEVRRADFQSLPIRTADRRHEAGTDNEVLDANPMAGEDGSEFTETDAPWWASIRANLQKIDLPRMAGSLAIVLGLYLGFVWVMKTFVSGGPRAVPKEVVNVLGVVPVGPKQRMQVIRLGSKLLLVVQTENGMQTVGEITDPDEADYLTSLCQGKPPRPSQRSSHRASSNTSARPQNLRAILNQLENALANESPRTHFDA